MFSYTVRCTFTDPTVVQSWLKWLLDEHIQDVIDAGALSGEIFRMDDSETYEIRYRFASKEAFTVYENDHAPRLRAEGLAKFPLELGLEYSRSTGESQFKLNC